MLLLNIYFFENQWNILAKFESLSLLLKREYIFNQLKGKIDFCIW